MSRLNRAWSRSGIGKFIFNPIQRKKLKEAFRAGWEAREMELKVDPMKSGEKVDND